MNCRKCNGAANVQLVAEIEPITFGTAVLYLILAIIPIIGWIILFTSVWNSRFRTVSYRVCQSCGYREKLD